MEGVHASLSIGCHNPDNVSRLRLNFNATCKQGLNDQDDNQEQWILNLVIPSQSVSSTLIGRYEEDSDLIKH